MLRWPSIAYRVAVIMVAVLCFAAATPLAAQQASGPAPQAAASSAPTTMPAGPRLRPEWQRADLGFAERSASGAAAAAGTTTITVTTLVLVLAVVILVLLIA